jgi:integrase
MLSRRCGQYGSVEKRNGMWRGRYLTDVPGEIARVKRAVTLGLVSEITKSEARRRLLHIIQTEGLNAPTYRIPSAELFAARVNAWRVGYLSRQKPSTQKQMEWQVQKYLLPKWGQQPAETISAEAVNEWIGTLTNLAPASLRSLVTTLQLILRRIFEKRQIHYPATVAARREIPCFTPEQMQRIVALAEKPWKALFAVARETGMRSGELYGLKVADIDFEHRLIHVRRAAWEGKTQSSKSANAYRSIDISESLAAMLKEHLGGRTSGFVFQTRSGNPLRNCYVVGRVLHPLLDKLEIERGGMHAFRHGRVSCLVESNTPIELVRVWIGHGSDAMVRRYTHLRAQSRKRVLSQIPALFSNKIDVIAPTATFAPGLLAVNF